MAGIKVPDRINRIDRIFFVSHLPDEGEETQMIGDVGAESA